MPICPNCHNYIDGIPNGECPICHKAVKVNGAGKYSAPSFYHSHSSANTGASAASNTPKSSPKFSKAVYHTANAGTTVCTFAKILFAINAIATIVCAIVFGRSGRYYSFNFGLFLLYLLIGGVMSTVTYIFLNAFGRLVEHTIFAAESTDECLRILGKFADEQISRLDQITEAQAVRNAQTETPDAAND